MPAKGLTGRLVKQYFIDFFSVSHAFNGKMDSFAQIKGPKTFCLEENCFHDSNDGVFKGH